MSAMGIVSGAGQLVWGGMQVGGEAVVEVTKAVVRAGTGTEVGTTAVALTILAVGTVGVFGLVVWKVITLPNVENAGSLYWKKLAAI